LMLASGDGIWREDDPAPSYSLSITPPSNGSVTSDSGGISCGAACSGYYVSGVSVTLTATADSGYVFSSWGGDCSGTSNPLTLTMTENTACSATFAAANAAPTASALTIIGTAQVGMQLTGGYTYADTDSDPENTTGTGTSYRFVRSTDNDVTTTGDNTDVATGTTGGAGMTYTLVGADQDNVLFYCVTPKAASGTILGTESCSSATATIAAVPTYSISDIPTRASGVTATLEASGCSGSSSANFIDAPAGAPASFPFGLLDFTLTGCATGGSATVTVTYSQNLPDGAVFYKHQTGSYATYPATLGVNSVTFTLIDGGVGDEDGVADGSISDPGGIGVLGSGIAAIPSLSQWGVIILSLLLAGITALRLRQGL
jgi:hypothetical protein